MPDICPQANHSHPLYTQAYTGNEDCLYLNVFRPTDIEEGRQLPVMVWLR
jgi:carboxylesterase type B